MLLNDYSFWANYFYAKAKRLYNETSSEAWDFHMTERLFLQTWRAKDLEVKELFSALAPVASYKWTTTMPSHNRKLAPHLHQVVVVKNQGHLIHKIISKCLTENFKIINPCS